ncbi:MAG: condensation domain-containing protein, partial [Bacteroidota bacterium]
MHSLDKALKYVYEKHDLLRARFVKNQGQWEGTISPEMDQNLLQIVRVSSREERDQKGLEIQSQLDLAEGPLFQALYFKSSEPSLLLFAHHLVVDMVSWSIILKDLDEAYELYHRQKKLPLLRKTSAYPVWTNHLAQLGQAEKVKSEKSYWQTQVGHLPPASTEARPESAYELLSFHLDAVLSQEILRELPQKYSIKTDEFLLAALANAYDKVFTQSKLTIGLEKHGRDVLAEDFDFSETVGWFTSYFPLRLELEVQDKDPFALKAIKEQVRQIPNAGLAYGLLRYLGGNSDLVAQPEIIFNYLGQSIVQELPALGSYEMYFKGARDPRSENYHSLELNVIFQEESFVFYLSFDTQKLAREKIELLSQTIIQYCQELKEFCLSGEDAGYSPSDFPEAGLSQDDLDNLLELL